MVELRFGLRTVDLPFTVRIPDVTEEMFDELVDEDTKAELFDGVMIVHSPASWRHNRGAGFLRTLAGLYSEEMGLGDVFGPDDLIHLAACRKFAPDAFFLLRGRVPDPPPVEEFEGAPDWLAEVLSPSNRDYDFEDKREAYHEARVDEIWFIDQANREVIVDRRRGRRYTSQTTSKGRVQSSVIDGFWVEAAWLWADQPPKAMRCLRQLLK